MSQLNAHHLAGTGNIAKLLGQIENSEIVTDDTVMTMQVYGQIKTNLGKKSKDSALT